MKERIRYGVELLLRKFNVGKEPAEAHGFTRYEQIWQRYDAWMARQKWLPAWFRLPYQMRGLKASAKTWASLSPTLVLLRAAIEFAERRPTQPATPAEMAFVRQVLGGSDTLSEQLRSPKQQNIRRRAFNRRLPWRW